MPSETGSHSRAVRIAVQSGDGTGQSLGIVLVALQTVEEVKQLIPRSIASVSAIRRSGLGERLLLHGECGLEVDLGGFHRFMPEPQRDDGAIDTRLQPIEGHGVTQNVGGDPFLFQRWTDLGCRRAMPDQQVLDAIGAETSASGVGE